MKILGFDIQLRKAPAAESKRPAASAWNDNSGGGGYANIFTMSFDGEKNLGEIGPIRRYIIDHEALRARSWQLYLESEICQLVMQRYAIWVIGAGLKLQAEPQKEVLVAEKLEMEPEAFNKAVESRFKVFAGDVMSDYSGLQNLHDKADEAFINAIIGGDVLVILRVDKDGTVKTQLIDGAHVATPMNFAFQDNEYVSSETGNRIRQGVEIDERGQPVAYHVRKGKLGLSFDRIPARGAKSGALMAFMVYGLKYRLDNMRGIPLITAVMETAAKMERYKEATLGSAEERQKIPYYIEHGVTSTGENPLSDRLRRASGFGAADDVPRDSASTALADKVAATTNKTVVNMPQDSKLVALESKNELHFKDFYTVNIDLVCATIGIPPEVAMSKYDSNFSASRAALKDWEHTLNVKRKKFADQFYQKIYALWLDVQVLQNKITAPGYLEALANRNVMAIAAYRSARFVGATVPHIDPLKEVNAERAKLGAGSAHLPLTTLEAATEALNGGDSYGNMAQYAREMQEADKLGIEQVEINHEVIEDFDEDEPGEKPAKKPAKKNGK